MLDPTHRRCRRNCPAVHGHGEDGAMLEILDQAAR